MQAEKMSWINLMKGKENTVRVTEIPFLATDIEMRKINQTQTVIAPTMNVNRMQELPFRGGVGFNIRVPPLIILSLDSADAVGAVIVIYLQHSPSSLGGFRMGVSCRFQVKSK